MYYFLQLHDYNNLLLTSVLASNLDTCYVHVSTILLLFDTHCACSSLTLANAINKSVPIIGFV